MAKIDWKEKAAQLEAQGVSVVDDLYQVELLRSHLLKKEYKSYYISSLSFTDKGKCLLSNLAVVPNRIYDLLRPVMEKDAVVMTAGGYVRTRPFYTKALLNIEVEGKVALAYLGARIYRVGDGKDTRFIALNARDKKHKSYIDLTRNEKVDRDALFQDDEGTLKEGVIVYNDLSIGAQTCSNGQLKKHNITLMADNLPGFDAAKAWKLVTYGASDLLCNGSDVSPKDIAQGNTRLSAWKAPSVPVGEVGTVAYYMGKLKFEGTDDEYRDGFAFLQAEYLSRLFTHHCQGEYFFMPWVTDGLMVQCRPWLNKVMAETVKKSYMNVFFKHNHMMDPDKVVILVRKDVTKEEQEAFTYAVANKGKARKHDDSDEGMLDYAGKVVIITDTAEHAAKLREAIKEGKWVDIHFFTDLNGLKAPYDLHQASALHMLDMSHSAHDVAHGSNTSTQLIQSMMVIDPERTMKVLERHAADWLKQKKEALLAEMGSAPRWEDFVGSSEDFRPDYQQILGRIAPQFAWKHYAPLYHSLVDNALKGYVTGIRRLNLPTAGAYTKVVPDSAADFGVRILGVKEKTEIEIVCPIGTLNEFKKLIGVKYPKMHFLEYLKGRIISWDEYAERIKACDKLTNEEKDVLIDHVRHISGGAIMVPAIEKLKNMLAGMDFDGDAIQLFFDKDIVDIMFQGETKAVVIDEEDVVPEKKTLDELDAALRASEEEPEVYEERMVAEDTSDYVVDIKLKPVYAALYRKEDKGRDIDAEAVDRKEYRTVCVREVVVNMNGNIEERVRNAMDAEDTDMIDIVMADGKTVYGTFYVNGKRMQKTNWVF